MKRKIQKHRFFNKKAGASVGTAIKVLTSVVLGAAMLAGMYGVVKTTVVPTTENKVSSMFEVTDSIELNGGGAGGGVPIPDPVVELKRNGTIPLNGIYYKGTELCNYCRKVYGIQGMNHGPMNDGCYRFTQSPTATYTSGQAFPATVEIGDIYVEDDFKYSYFSDGWHVSVLENKALYTGTILSEINGKRVTNMEYTFLDCTSLTTAPVIPNSVTNMHGTFSGCASLAVAPTIPSGVTNMYSTFYGCAFLTTAPAIPSSVTSMHDTFNGCTSLTAVPAIPNSVANMEYTFRDCTSLTTAPDMSNANSVTNMDSTFSNCTSLTTAPAIPNSVTNMDSTFSFCTSLTTAPTIPNSVTNMTETFYHCTSLTTAPAIPNSVTNMDSTFYNCASLTTASTIPSSVTNMYRTFYKCTSLTTPPDMSNANSVTNMASTFGNCTSLTTAPAIPSSVTNMPYTFDGCTNLTGTIEVNANPTSYSNYNQCLKSTQITGITGSCSQTTKNRLMATK